jgi:hypothetical protein
LVPDTATEAAVEGAVAERGGDHLDVGSGSHQGPAPAAPPDGGKRNFLLCFLPWWCCVRRVGYAVRETTGGGGKGKPVLCLPWLEQLLYTIPVLLLWYTTMWSSNICNQS